MIEFSMIEMIAMLILILTIGVGIGFYLRWFIHASVIEKDDYHEQIKKSFNSGTYVALSVLNVMEGIDRPKKLEIKNELLKVRIK